MRLGCCQKYTGAVALAGGAGRGIFVGGDHGAGLQAVTVLVLDGISLVIENRTQALVQMGNVIAAVEKNYRQRPSSCNGCFVSNGGRISAACHAEAGATRWTRAPRNSVNAQRGRRDDEDEALPVSTPMGPDRWVAGAVRNFPRPRIRACL